jgi:lipoate-protein ligase B
MKQEWMLDESKIPVGDPDRNGKQTGRGNGQQWAYRLGYKDGQRKLLEWLIKHFWGKDEIVQNILKEMLKQLEEVK